MRTSWVPCLLALLLAACAAPRMETASPAPSCSEEGLASWYRPQAVGSRTADGETTKPGELTAAHRSLPFGTEVRVTNLETGRSVTVRITDRGPLGHGRIIDLSAAAAKALDMRGEGVARVRLEIPQPPPGVVAGGPSAATAAQPAVATAATACLLPHTTES